MRRTLFWVIPLVLLLLVTNGFWFYVVVDQGVTQTYQTAAFTESEEALTQALAIIRANAEARATQASVIMAARQAGPDLEPFEKEGYLWVGWLGLRFDAQGRCVEAVRRVQDSP